MLILRNTNWALYSPNTSKSNVRNSSVEFRPSQNSILRSYYEKYYFLILFVSLIVLYSVQSYYI